MIWIIVYLAAVNVIALALIGIDKNRAKTHRWRIPEKTLFTAAILGGGLGACAGMWLFRHKTKHCYFRYGLPAILVIETALCVWLASRYL